MEIPDSRVALAYRKLKRFVYYDKTNLFLRAKLAAFEQSSDFSTKLEEISNLLAKEKPYEDPEFINLLSNVSSRIIPKSFAPSVQEELQSKTSKGRFISNWTIKDEHRVTKVNYIIDAPIELHIIDVVWIMEEGYLLDRSMGRECCGARLEKSVGRAEDNGSGLFQKYHELYSRWRDSGIIKAKEILERDKTNVYILGLDIQQYYYHIALKCGSMPRLSDIDSCHQVTDQSSSLLKCIFAIHDAFRSKTQHNLSITHPGIPIGVGIPIGMCSSPIFANWHLRSFDKLVLTKLRPAYYGRYVDDILLVLSDFEDAPSTDDPIGSLLETLFCKNNILNRQEGDRYELCDPSGLFLQQEKCILQYFNSDYSIAGLDKFKKKLEEIGSNFLLMPVDEADVSLEDVAYDLLYEGSVNKFRSVKGTSENRYELAKHLARQTILHLHTNDSIDPDVASGVLKFFKGRNAIEFYELWERVLTFCVISNAQSHKKIMEQEMRRQILNTSHEDDRIKEIIKFDLEQHLVHSVSMSNAYAMDLDESNDITVLLETQNLQNSNMLRHHFVAKPLINYTHNMHHNCSCDIAMLDSQKTMLSPRYAHIDECCNYAAIANPGLSPRALFEKIKFVYSRLNKRDIEGIRWNLSDNAEERQDDEI